MLKKTLCKLKGHDFVSLRYKVYNNNEQHEKIKTCKRCGFEEAALEKHSFVITDEYGKDCMRYKRCEQCGGQFNSHSEHEYAFDNGRLNIVAVETSEPCVIRAEQCIRCGNIRHITQHEMEITDSHIFYQDNVRTVRDEQYTCKKCGLVEIKRDIEHHDW